MSDKPGNFGVVNIGEKYMEIAEKKVKEAALILFEMTGASGFVLPIPNTTPPLFLAVGEKQSIASMLNLKSWEYERILLGQFADVKVGDFVRCRVRLGKGAGIVKELVPSHRYIQLENGWCLHQDDELLEHIPASALAERKEPNAELTGRPLADGPGSAPG